jgi:hypothetical protein
MSHSDGSESADPDPSDTPGLSPRGEFRQGDTPPIEGSTLDTGPQETYNPATGWAWPIYVIAAGCLLVAGFFIARLVLMYL